MDFDDEINKLVFNDASQERYCEHARNSKEMIDR